MRFEKKKCYDKIGIFGRDPWSRGYGWQIMYWVRIPEPNNGWTFGLFTLICCTNCIVCLRRPKINEKEAGVGPSIYYKLAYLHEWELTLKSARMGLGKEPKIFTLASLKSNSLKNASASEKSPQNIFKLNSKLSFAPQKMMLMLTYDLWNISRSASLDLS